MSVILSSPGGLLSEKYLKADHKLVHPRPFLLVIHRTGANRR